MKQLPYIMLLLALSLASCIAPPGQPQTGQIQVAPTASSGGTVPAALTPAQQMAIQALSKELGLPAEQIKLVTSEAVEWPDGCLGVRKIGVMCTESIVPGFRIVLAAQDKQYEVHTNQDGTVALLAGAPQEGANTAQSLVVKQLAKALGKAETDIKVVSSTPIEWPDACLGMAQPDVVCAQVITPGFIFVLAADALQYEYHTNADGSQVVAGTVELAWHRAGGIVGFCDDLLIYEAGEVHVTSCKPQAFSADGALTPDERTQFDQWLTQLGQVDLTQKDPAAADAMSMTLTLTGSGTGTPTAADQQALFAFAQAVFQRMHP